MSTEQCYRFEEEAFPDAARAFKKKDNMSFG